MSVSYLKMTEVVKLVSVSFMISYDNRVIFVTSQSHAILNL